MASEHGTKVSEMMVLHYMKHKDPDCKLCQAGKEWVKWVMDSTDINANPAKVGLEQRQESES